MIRERFPDDYFNVRKPCDSIEGYREEHGNLLCVIALRLNPQNYLPSIDGDLESIGIFTDLYGIQVLTTRSEDLKNVSLWEKMRLCLRFVDLFQCCALNELILFLFPYTSHTISYFYGNSLDWNLWNLACHFCVNKSNLSLLNISTE